MTSVVSSDRQPYKARIFDASGEPPSLRSGTDCSYYILEPADHEMDWMKAAEVRQPRLDIFEVKMVKLTVQYGNTP